MKFSLLLSSSHRIIKNCVKCAGCYIPPSSQIDSPSGSSARNGRRNFAALNGLTNLVVNAFLVRNNAAACVIVAFIPDHKSRASLGPNARRIVVVCVSLVLVLVRFWEYTQRRTTTTSVCSVSFFPFFFISSFFTCEKVYTGCQSASLKYSHNYPQQLITGGVTINY